MCSLRIVKLLFISHSILLFTMFFESWLGYVIFILTSFWLHFDFILTSFWQTFLWLIQTKLQDIKIKCIATNEWKIWRNSINHFNFGETMPSPLKQKIFWKFFDLSLTSALLRRTSFSFISFFGLIIVYFNTLSNLPVNSNGFK